MSVLIIGTANTPFGQKLSTVIKHCRLITATHKEYSVYDPLTKTRLLHKFFVTNDKRKAFDYSNRFDIFRIFAIFCQNLADDVLASNYAPDIVQAASPYLCFLSQPVLPVVMQQVGMGIDHDLMYCDRPYRILSDGKMLPFGYDILYDLRNAYFLGSEKPRFVLLNYMKKAIFVPGTELFTDAGVAATDALTGAQIQSQIDELWAIPRAQYCKKINLYKSEKT